MLQHYLRQKFHISQNSSLGNININNAWKNLSLIKDMETLLCTVHMVFSTLSVKKFRFEEMA
jgi:hypothetical protein